MLSYGGEIEMYVKGQAVDSLKKFHDYVVIYQSKLNNKLAEIEEQLSLKTIADTIKSEKDYNFILQNRDVLIKLDNSLDSKLKIIEFLVKNQATSAEQFKKVVDEVVNSNVINDFERTATDLLKLQNQIKLNLQQCDLIISAGNYDEDYYIKLLEMSGLSEEDKLNILSDKAFNAVVMQSQVNVDVEPESINDNYHTELDGNINVSSSMIEERYAKIMTPVNDMITKYYYLIEKQNSNQLKYKRQYISAIRDQSGEIDYRALSSIEDRLILIILEMIENKQLIDQEIKKIVNHSISKEDEELINMFLDTLESDLQASLESSKQLELDKQEENNVNSSKILFLLNEQGQPYTNLREINFETSKRIKSLIEKLEKGMHDYERGIKHTKVLTDNSIDDIYVNRSSNISCAYMRLTKDIVLLIAIDDSASIYDLSKSICCKQRQIINKYRNLSETELFALIQAQGNIVDDIYDRLAGKGDVKNNAK